MDTSMKYIHRPNPESTEFHATTSNHIDYFPCSRLLRCMMYYLYWILFIFYRTWTDAIRSRKLSTRSRRKDRKKMLHTEHNDVVALGILTIVVHSERIKLFRQWKIFWEHENFYYLDVDTYLLLHLDIAAFTHAKTR